MFEKEFSSLKKEMIKNGITAAGLINFTPDFYSVFKSEYIRSHNTGAACYFSVFGLPFYTENGGDYCLFLEVFNRSTMAAEINHNAKIKRCKRALKKYCDSGYKIKVLNTELLKVFRDLETAYNFLNENGAGIERS